MQIVQVRNAGIPLEVCLSSNLHTGAAESIESHPFPLFHELGFRVTLNTDNRLMSRTSMSEEYELAVEAFGLTLDDLETISINSIKSAFVHFDLRCRLIHERVMRGFREIRAEHGFAARRRHGETER